METSTAPGTARRIEYVDLDDVVGTEGNPKAHDIPAVIRSICSLGFTDLGVMDERTDRLIIGHGRLEALRTIRDHVTGGTVPDEYEPVFREAKVKRGITGDDDEPCAPDGIRVADDGSWLMPLVRGWASRDDDHARAAVVASNQLTIKGGWFDRGLAEWLDDIADGDVDLLGVTGFTREDLDDMLDRLAPPPDLDDLADEYGDPNDSDLWPVLRIKVPPHVRNAFYDLTENAGGGEDSTRFIHLVELMQDALDKPTEAPA